MAGLPLCTCPHSWSLRPCICWGVCLYVHPDTEAHSPVCKGGSGWLCAISLDGTWDRGVPTTIALTASPAPLPSARACPPHAQPPPAPRATPAVGSAVRTVLRLVWGPWMGGLVQARGTVLDTEWPVWCPDDLRFLVGGRV